jgi:hypothetical protein
VIFYTKKRRIPNRDTGLKRKKTLTSETYYPQIRNSDYYRLLSGVAIRMYFEEAISWVRNSQMGASSLLLRCDNSLTNCVSCLVRKNKTQEEEGNYSSVIN